MNVTPTHLRNALLVLAAVAAGYAAGRPAHVVEAQSSSRGSRSSSTAASDDPLTFQFTQMNTQTAFTVYNPSQHMLYVYEGMNTGGAHMNCTFTLRLTRLGGPVDRQPCAPGSPF